jgi:hypothetical protein
MTVSVVFIVDLVQDVNTLRPLMALARQATGHALLVAVSRNFDSLDSAGTWGRELAEICGTLGIPVHRFNALFEVYQLLQGHSGLLVSASESDARAHATSHALFLAAPPGFVRVTLQHGFECLGFLHNAAHDRSHWSSAIFNADVICGWFGNGLLRSVAPSESSKLLVTGPPLLIDCGDTFGRRMETAVEPPHARPACLVCENLHSVRLGTSVLKSGFITQFADFARESENLGWDLWLRPHPAGRYSDSKGAGLPPNVQRSNGPIYKEDLGRYRFAISAPSSILFDLIAAGVPVAVWQDADGTIDCRNYPGLPRVTGVDEWVAFGQQVLAGRERFVARQAEFLEGLAMPQDVTAAYRSLLQSAG